MMGSLAKGHPETPQQDKSAFPIDLYTHAHADADADAHMHINTTFDPCIYSAIS